MTDPGIESQLANLAIQASRLLVGAYNLDPDYLRRREWYVALRAMRHVTRDLMPDAAFMMPEAPDA